MRIKKVICLGCSAENANNKIYDARFGKIKSGGRRQGGLPIRAKLIMISSQKPSL